MLDFEVIAKSLVATNPFSYFLTETAMRKEAVAAANGDFPNIAAPGIFPLSALSYGLREKTLLPQQF